MRFPFVSSLLPADREVKGQKIFRKRHRFWRVARDALLLLFNNSTSAGNENKPRLCAVTLWCFCTYAKPFCVSRDRRPDATSATFVICATRGSRSASCSRTISARRTTSSGRPDTPVSGEPWAGFAQFQAWTSEGGGGLWLPLRILKFDVFLLDFQQKRLFSLFRMG